MSTINYSKWDNIEVSDDEDDTHPNVDTGSLFRWRHQARVERMEQSSKEKEDFKESKKLYEQKLAIIRSKIQKAESEGVNDELKKLKLEESDIKKQEKKFREKEDELEKKERLTPWNIDTICKDGTSKTIINKSMPLNNENLSEDDRAEKQRVHTHQYKDEMKKFGMFQKYDDSQQYLTEKSHLVCEETANYLVLWCIELECEEKKLMEHVAHQTIVMQFILELGKQLEMDPRGCVRPFFSRIKMAEQQYMDAFNDELSSFKERVRARAKARIEEAMKEYEEEEKQKRLGPGGLDPVDVFESLPQVMKDCFEEKDISKLQKAIVDLPKEEAEYHMKRCVESGLWVPNKEDLPQEGAEKAEGEEEVEEEEEEVYEDVAEN